MITGVTLIRNGCILNYPWKETITSLLSCCEKVIVNVDPNSEDNTLEQVYSMAKYYPIQVVESIWDMKNTGDGRELAVQINKLLPLVQSDWILYLQADEMVHEKDAADINILTDSATKHITQIEFYRTYFWESLNQRYTPHELFLGRLFRTGTHRIGGDGMHLIRQSGEVHRSPFWIYHYSRMGDERDVNKRIRTLDRLFHDETTVNNFSNFSYKEVDSKYLIRYDWSHPSGVEKFYG